MPQTFIKPTTPESSEVRALRSLRHTGIIPLISDHSADPEPHLVLPKLEGPTLKERIAACPLTEEEADQLATRILAALCHVHQCGWLHNDVSPSNIILTAEGPVLIDFSAASQLDSPRPHLVGTIHYMAPERFQDIPPGPASDLYSLGVVLFEAVTGHLPFEAASSEEIIAAHHLHQFARITDLRPGLSPALVHLVSRLTSRQPRDRMAIFNDLPPDFFNPDHPPMIPLEDLHTDVLGKSQRGLKLDDASLATRAGITVEQLTAAKSGASLECLPQLASALGLHGPSLLAMARSEWRPEPVKLEGLEQFNTPFDDMTVNGYVIYDAASGQAAAFDTGATAQPMADFIRAKGLKLAHVFITHTHPDHIADIETLRDLNPSVEIHTNAMEPASGGKPFHLSESPSWKIGNLTVQPRLTTGHSKGGTSYVVSGLVRPVVVVGDALFASSMGGGMVSFADALATNRAQLFTLADETVVCPGHGPLTTIGEEKLHNPFYPEYKTQA